MKSNYLFYLLQNTKALSIIGFLFSALIFFSPPWKGYGSISFLDRIGGIAGMIVIVILFFIIPLFLASLFRWILQKYSFIHILFTFFIFYGYGYLLFFSTDERYMQYNPQEGFKYFMLFVTLIFIGLSEWFIYRAQKHNSES